jgi:ubiquinone/menaquinone biosynthesis methyltransferase
MEWLTRPDERKRYNERLFTTVAPKYDSATRMLSFGRDAIWKRALIDSLPPMPSPLCLDVACGSGDLTAALAEKYAGGRIVGIDLTPAMIDRARSRNHQANVEFRVEDMCSLAPIATESIDIVTGGYALRNAQELPRLLHELARVLKPGGAAAFLEFANADNAVRRSIHRTALNLWGGVCGLVLHGDPEVYRYIPRTLKTFPSRSALIGLMNSVGIEPQGFQTYFTGVIEISLWRKPAPY